MTSALEAFREFAANVPQEVGALEIKVNRRVSAKFYAAEGKIYSLVIKGHTPPLAQRLKWSIDQDAHTDTAKEIMATTHPDRLANYLLETQTVTQKTIDAAARDFFLTTAEEILYGWDNVKTSWHRNDQVGTKEALYVPATPPQAVLDRIERRAQEVARFVAWLGIDFDDLLHVQIEAGVADPAPASDAEQLLLSLAPDAPTFATLINEAGWMGAAPIVRASYKLWERDAVRFSLRGTPLRNEPRHPQPAPVGKPDLPPVVHPPKPSVVTATTPTDPVQPVVVDLPDEPVVVPVAPIDDAPLQPVVPVDVPSSETAQEALAPATAETVESVAAPSETSPEEAHVNAPTEPIAVGEPVTESTPESPEETEDHETPLPLLAGDETVVEEDSEPTPEESQEEEDNNEYTDSLFGSEEANASSEGEGEPEPQEADEADFEDAQQDDSVSTEEKIDAVPLSVADLDPNEDIDALFLRLAEAVPLLRERLSNAHVQEAEIEASLEAEREVLAQRKESFEQAEREHEEQVQVHAALGEKHEDLIRQREELERQLEALNNEIVNVTEETSNQERLVNQLEENVEQSGVDYEAAKALTKTLEESLVASQKLQRELQAKIDFASRLLPGDQ